MSDDQLPEDLAALFAAERAAPVAADSAKAIVKVKLTASLAGVPLGAGASMLGVAGKFIGVLALTVGIGAGAIAVTRGGGEQVDVPPSPRVEIAVPMAAARVEPDRASDPPSEPTVAPLSPTVLDRAMRPPRRAALALDTPAPVKPIAIPDVPPSPDTTPPFAPAGLAPAPPTPPADIIAAVAPAVAPESALLAQAWSALSNREAARALALVRDGEHAYPGGPLSEERQAIRVSALSQLRRRDETRAAATQFLTNYPHSIHRPLVKRALEEAP